MINFKLDSITQDIIQKFCIQVYPSEILSQSLELVSNNFFGTKNLILALESMCQIMESANGIGIAANQIGLNARIIVISKSIINDLHCNVKSSFNGSDSNIAFINPEIIDFSIDNDVENEGCLSFPGLNVKVSRSKLISVSYYNEFGQLCKLKANGLFARCLQHEIDHINGKVFIDRVNVVKKRIVLNGFMKQR